MWHVPRAVPDAADGGRLPGRLGRGITHRVSAPTSAATRLRSVAELVDPAFPGLAAGQRGALMYCVITNAAHAAGTDPAELLAALPEGMQP